MNNEDVILKYLAGKKDEWFCDDCLSGETDIRPRQQVNQITNRLKSNGRIRRRKNSCSICGKRKKSSSFKGEVSDRSKRGSQLDDLAEKVESYNSSRSKGPKEGLQGDPERAFDVGKRLYDAFNSPEGIFGHTNMPEGEPPEGVERTSYEHLMFITMTVSIDYMRDADKLWEAARKTYEDPDTRWIFDPKEVVSRGKEELKEAMTKYGLAKKPDKDSKKIWYPIAKSFTRYDGDPTNLIEHCDRDAHKLYKKMKGPLRGMFPYLKGDKILPLWIRMLKDQVGIELENMNKISIPVDIHIARSTFTSGALKGRYEGDISGVKERIHEVWKDACEGTDFYPLEFDEALWKLSKHGCSRRGENSCRLKDECPIGDLCVDGKISVSQEEVVVRTGEASSQGPAESREVEDKAEPQIEPDMPTDFKYNVSHSNNRGIVFLGDEGDLKRDRLPDKDEWRRLYVGGEEYWMKPAKVALNVVRPKKGSGKNVLDALLRELVGEEAITPGGETSYVTIDPVEEGDPEEGYVMKPYDEVSRSSTTSKSPSRITKSPSEEVKKGSVSLPDDYSFDPEEVLVLIPCCSGKKGRSRYFETERRVEDFISEDTANLLYRGREECSEDIDGSEGLIQALARYDGFLYSAEFESTDFKPLVAQAVKEKGMHLLIVSASYGLLRPEEKIGMYDKTMGERRKYWSDKIYRILGDYVSQNGIKAVYGFFGKSTPYMDVVRKTDWSSLDVKDVKLFYPANYSGTPYKTVPKMSGKGVIALIQSGFNTDKMTTEFERGDLGHF